MAMIEDMDLIWFSSVAQMGALPWFLGYHIMVLFAVKGTDTCFLHFCQSINVRKMILSLSFDNLISIWPDLLSLVDHLDQLNIALAVVDTYYKHQTIAQFKV